MPFCGMSKEKVLGDFKMFWLGTFVLENLTSLRHQFHLAMTQPVCPKHNPDSCSKTVLRLNPFSYRYWRAKSKRKLEGIHNPIHAEQKRLLRAKINM